MKKGKRLLERAGTAYHTARAYGESVLNGGMKSIKRTKSGTQYNYKNGTGYWVDKK